MDYIIDFDTPHSLGERSEDGFTSKKWLKSDDVYSSCKDSEIVTKLDTGTYSVFQDARGGTHASKFQIETDELYFLPNNNINTVVAEVADFWKKGDRFKQYKMKHKRGILFMGPPGTGKTSVINLLVSSLIDNDGLVFYIDNHNELFWYIEFIQNHLRLIEPDRPIITVIEDIDKFMDGGGIESALLNFLDGNDSVDHQITIATTNRLSNLNDLLLRPSRFDWHIKVDKPNEEVREAFLINKGLDKETAHKWAADTDNYSIAELKELFCSVILLDIEYDVAKTKIKDQADNVQNQTFVEKPKTGVGFKLGK